MVTVQGLSSPPKMPSGRTSLRHLRCQTNISLPAEILSWRRTATIHSIEWIRALFLNSRHGRCSTLIPGCRLYLLPTSLSIQSMKHQPQDSPMELLLALYHKMFAQLQYSHKHQPQHYRYRRRRQRTIWASQIKLITAHEGCRSTCDQILHPTMPQAINAEIVAFERRMLGSISPRRGILRISTA